VQARWWRWRWEPDQRVRLEGGVRPRRRRHVRAAHHGVRRWTVWCRSAPATQHPFRLLESGRRRLSLPRLPQAAPTSGGRSSGTAAPASRAAGRRRLRLERRSSGHIPARKCQYLFSTRTLSASTCSCCFTKRHCMSISEDSVNKYSSKLELV
jgi:hypothetical protein